MLAMTGKLLISHKIDGFLIFNFGPEAKSRLSSDGQWAAFCHERECTALNWSCRSAIASPSRSFCCWQNLRF